jgi:ABC-type bacteriocin/lantibiotic exporter with double-glycine peptidase domain
VPKIDTEEANKYHLPELMNRFFEIINIQKGLSKILLDIPLAVIQILFGLILISFYNPTYILLGFMLVILLYFILKYTTAKGLTAAYIESENKYAVASWLEEIGRSYKSFKISGQNNFHLKKADHLISDYLISKTKHFEILKFQYWSLIFFKLLISAIMLIIGAVLLIDQKLNIGQFIAAEIVIILILTAVEKLILNLEVVYTIITGLEKIDAINSKQDEKNGTIHYSENNAGVEIDVRNLNYIVEQKSIIKEASFTIQAGEKVCVMGDGGAGKSILLELIGGTLKNYDGVININKLPLNNLDQTAYRKNMGIFFHEQDIFDGTLFENICMGNEGIEAPRIMEIAEVLDLYNFISELPDGLNTRLQPTGKGLSTIIAKKILLMRAIVNNPSLLMLDEPFELAGAESSRKITAYLLNLKNTTCFVVSGYIPFAEKADKIIWLEKGMIKYIGTPQSILPLVS